MPVSARALRDEVDLELRVTTGRDLGAQAPELQKDQVLECGVDVVGSAEDRREQAHVAQGVLLSQRQVRLAADVSAGRRTWTPLRAGRGARSRNARGCTTPCGCTRRTAQRVGGTVTKRDGMHRFEQQVRVGPNADTTQAAGGGGGIGTRGRSRARHLARTSAPTANDWTRSAGSSETGRPVTSFKSGSTSGRLPSMGGRSAKVRAHGAQGPSLPAGLGGGSSSASAVSLNHRNHGIGVAAVYGAGQRRSMSAVTPSAASSRTESFPTVSRVARRRSCGEIQSL